MVRLHAAGCDGEAFSSYVSLLATHRDLEVVGTSTTGAEAAEMVKSGGIDALIFPFDWADVIRTLKLSVTAVSQPSFVAVTQPVTTPVLARSLACDFDGVVDSAVATDSAARHIQRVIAGESRLEDEPSLRGLGLSRGLLVRELVLTGADDRHLADLVGTGLSDEEIAIVMGWNIQTVRNNIERLLAANDLLYRIQLAVVRASLLKVPDFF